MSAFITHSVKSWPAFFEAAIDGRKTHDFRNKYERNYKIGDFLELNEYNPFVGDYTGRKALFRITYITSNDTPCALSSNALDRDTCVLSIRKVDDIG